MDNCIICLNDKNLISYQQCCKVLVHKKCIDEWNKKNDYKCIICRKSDLDYYDQPVEFGITIEYEFDKFILALVTIFVLMILILVK